MTTIYCNTYRRNKILIFMYQHEYNFRFVKKNIYIKTWTVVFKNYFVFKNIKKLMLNTNSHCNVWCCRRNHETILDTRC